MVSELLAGLLVTLLATSFLIIGALCRRARGALVRPEVILDLERIAARRAAHEVKWAVRREADRARREVRQQFRKL